LSSGWLLYQLSQGRPAALQFFDSFSVGRMLVIQLLLALMRSAVQRLPLRLRLVQPVSQARCLKQQRPTDKE